MNSLKASSSRGVDLGGRSFGSVPIPAVHRPERATLDEQLHRRVVDVDEAPPPIKAVFACYANGQRVTPQALTWLTVSMAAADSALPEVCGWTDECVCLEFGIGRSASPELVMRLHLSYAEAARLVDAFALALLP